MKTDRRIRFAWGILTLVLFITIFVPTLCSPRGDDIAFRRKGKVVQFFKKIKQNRQRHGGLLRIPGTGKGQIIRLFGTVAGVIGKTYIDAMVGPYKYSVAFIAGGFEQGVGAIQKDFNPLHWQQEIVQLSRPGGFKRSMTELYAELNPAMVMQKRIDQLRRPRNLQGSLPNGSGMMNALNPIPLKTPLMNVQSVPKPGGDPSIIRIANGLGESRIQ